MITAIKKVFSVILVLVMTLAVQGEKRVHAQNTVTLSALGVSYTQDFNSLSVSQESSFLPVGWALKETGTGVNNAYMPGAGKINTPDTYSFGAKDSTDRALGMIRGDEFVPMIGASFTNNTGGVIQSLLITYTGEQWRAGKAGQKDKILFEFSTDATTLENGEWTTVTNLIYFSNKSEKVESKDGNSDQYRQTLSDTITGLSIEEGKTFWIRWTDFNRDIGDDDGLAVDDFSITPLGVDNPPTIMNITPTNQAIDVALDADIKIAYSEPVDLTTNWFNLDCSSSGSHTAIVSGGPQVFTLQSIESFENGETCTITIMADQVSDQDAVDPPSLMEDNYTSSFTTLPFSDSAPSVSSTNPSDDESSVALDSILVVHFSEPVATAPGWFGLECSKSGLHPAEVLDGPTIFTLTPKNPFVYEETCTLIINALKVTDEDGDDPPDVMSENYVSSFTTLSTPDSAPTISDISPGNDQTGVDIGQDIVVTFSEPVDYEDEWFELTCSLSGSHEAQVTGGPTSFTINPEQNFNYDETCSLMVKAEKVTDVDTMDPPDAMLMNQTVSFLTAHQPDLAPVITGSTPSAGAEEVVINSNITIHFSEPITPSGSWFDLNCSSSGIHTASIAGDSQDVVINPDFDFAYGEVCLLRITASQISDVDTDDLPDKMEADYSLSFSTAFLLDEPPTIMKTEPIDNATGSPISGDLKVTFSEPVTLLTGWVDLTCSKSGNHGLFLSGGPTDYSFGSARNFAYAEKCTVKLTAQYIVDQDEVDPPDSMAGDYTFSFTTIPDPASLVYPVVVIDRNTHPFDGEVMDAGLKVLKVQFSKEVLHDGSADAANNPENYRLISIGANKVFETETCDAANGDDIRITIDHIDYDEDSYRAELHVNQGNDLASGIYRLIVCGAHTIRDLDGNAINDGLNTVITFTIAPQFLGEGDTEEEDDSSTLPKTAIKKGLFIPVTGFAPDRHTVLPRQNISYSEQGDLRIEIPSMKLEIPIVGVPQDEGVWDVTWLEDQAGWLEGSAFPTFEGNAVLTAHVWDANNQPGPFYRLEKLKYDDQVIIHAWGEEYVYEVREVKSVLPDNVNAMMKHQDSPWITLVTCQGYDEKKGEYQHRILVRAVLVEVR